ncbi:hypothetical protein AB0H88_02095 [Nonomuraea sp. NPDC050680]|uniref:hypothetical protein n=1 Tax=Nonomuraea sp. NPDC050680 TaxID=3154630 RepID=UPI0033F10A29
MISRLAAAAWGLVVAAALVAAPLALRDRLPDPLAAHWRSGLVPDGERSFTALPSAVVRQAASVIRVRRRS